MVPERRRSLAESNILIVWPNGPGSLGPKLKSFIQQHRRIKSASFLFVGHPVPIPTALFRESEFVFLSGQDGSRRIVLPRAGYIGLPSFIMDWVLTLLFIVKTRRRYDICITMSLHLLLLGILLRSMGVVKQAVSVVEEYNPPRYGLPLLRRLYRRIASWCLVRSDFVVQTSPLLDEVLIRDGIRVNPLKQIIIPQPVDSSEIGFLPLDQLEPDSVVSIGQMTAEHEFELVVEAMDLVARKRPAVIVTVTSYTKLPAYLLEMIREKGLERHFRLLGFTRDEAELMNVVRKNRVALAIYRPTATSKKYADVFRPWVYMANGVPTIITRVPPVAAEIENAGAGVVIDYEREQLAEAILSLLTDDQLHHRCRQNGLALVRRRTTGPVLRELLVKLGIPADSLTTSVNT